MQLFALIANVRTNLVRTFAISANICIQCEFHQYLPIVLNFHVTTPEYQNTNKNQVEVYVVAKHEKAPDGPSLKYWAVGDVSVVEQLASEKHVLEWIFRLYHACWLSRFCVWILVQFSAPGLRTHDSRHGILYDSFASKNCQFQIFISCYKCIRF